ncbi:MAG TPA: hypothetical protein VFC03_17110 [Acidimicrobiales bacterium]|nr:hypothetical protein [Acidimicrobiales bacterium]
MSPGSPSSTARSRAGSGRPTVQPPAGAERLLSGVGANGTPVDLADHLDRWGPVPTWQGTASGTSGGGSNR